MSDTSNIRCANLNALCLRLGWTSRKGDNSGSPSELINRLGRTSSYWSDRLRGRKPIGAELAREIEEALNLPKYSLDGDEEHSDFVQVSQLSIGVSEEPDAESMLMAELGALQFRRDFLRSVGVSAVNAALVHVAGTSMEPTFRDGAVILLNRADRTPRRGSVYAFAWEGQMLVRRFQRVGHVWHAVADNADKGEHPDIVISGKAEGLVQGRAIWVGAKL
ncbi:S24 family peptidase [Delftia tsuruhatensis]